MCAAEGADEAGGAAGAGECEHVGECGCADELESAVETVRRCGADGVRKGVIVDDDVVGADVVQQVGAARVAGGGDDGRAELMGDRDGGEPDR